MRGPRSKTHWPLLLADPAPPTSICGKTGSQLRLTLHEDEVTCWYCRQAMGLGIPRAS